MQIPIIYAHPETGGHCAEILKGVKKVLKSGKKDFKVYDLYGMKYDPVLHESEHYTAGRRKISSENKAFQKVIKDAETMIFIYPIWWGYMPAMLKGFFDRILTPGFAYRYVDGRVRGLLEGRKAIIFTTSGGPKILYTLTFNLPKRMICSFILRFCGLRSSYHQVGSCTRLDDKKALKIRKVVGKALSRL
jgi:NAD(P)H dehydrogenase (quinone)